MIPSFFSNGLHFECQRCSGCCKGGPGFVYLSQADLDAFTALFHLSSDDFIKQYCRWVDLQDGREVLSLTEKKNYDCIFWETGKGCAVYPSRPLQCSSYPFWFSILRGGKENWDSMGEHCPGINKGNLHTEQEIQEWLAKRENQPYITRKVSIGD